MKRCNTFGRRLKCLRRWRDLTQQQLARYAFVTHSCVSYIERDRKEPLVSTARALAYALAVPLEVLVCDAPCPSCGDGSILAAPGESA